MPIRYRIAAVSTVATLVILCGAGILFLTTLRSGLQNSLDNSLRSRAEQVATQLSSGSGISPIGPLHVSDNSYAQLLSPAGVVRRSTTQELDVALLTPSQAAQLTSTPQFFDVSIRHPAPGDPKQALRVIGVAAVGGDIIAVGMSRDTVDEAVERAGKQLLILGTAALVVVAPGSWLLAAASLKPVERLRAQASVLEAQDAGGGLTVPRTRDEISRLARTFNDLLARLHATLEREQTFVADAGHELRTPLTVLRGELELARRPGRRKQELEAAIEVAAEETERLIRLTEDLLTLARDADGGSLRWVPVDLNELLDVACRRAQSGHIDKRVELTFVGGAVPTGEADPDRLRQALDNVLNNALRFAPPASDVRVSVRHEDGWIDVGIEDDGPGFPPDLLPYAFERFRQGDSARTRASQSGLTDNGTGLGLAIVRGIMRAHGGLVHAANHEGGGAVVTLRWPLTRHAAPTGARRRQ